MIKTTLMMMMVTTMVMAMNMMGVLISILNHEHRYSVGDVDGDNDKTDSYT